MFCQILWWIFCVWCLFLLLLCLQRCIERLGGVLHSLEQLTHAHLQQVGNRHLLISLALHNTWYQMITPVFLTWRSTISPVSLVPVLNYSPTTSVSSSSSPTLCTSAANNLTLRSPEFQLTMLTIQRPRERAPPSHFQTETQPGTLLTFTKSLVKSLNYLLHHTLPHCLFLGL